MRKPRRPAKKAPPQTAKVSPALALKPRLSAWRAAGLAAERKAVWCQGRRPWRIAPPRRWRAPSDFPVVSAGLVRAARAGGAPPRAIVPAEFPLRGRFAKREEWWVIVGDEARDKILAIKRFPLPPAGAIKKKIKFRAPDTTGRFSGRVWLISDSYRGADADAEIVLDVVE